MQTNLLTQVQTSSICSLERVGQGQSNVKLTHRLKVDENWKAYTVTGLSLKPF